MDKTTLLTLLVFASTILLTQSATEPRVKRARNSESEESLQTRDFTLENLSDENSDVFTYLLSFLPDSDIRSVHAVSKRLRGAILEHIYIDYYKKAVQRYKEVYDRINTLPRDLLPLSSEFGPLPSEEVDKTMILQGFERLQKASEPIFVALKDMEDWEVKFGFLAWEEQFSVRRNKLSVGQNYAVTLLEDGSVYTWGKGIFGTLGHGRKHDVLLPKRVRKLRGVKVVKVATASVHVVALAEDGRVFAWGNDYTGIPATSINSYAQLFPKQVDIQNKTIVDISSVREHTVALAKDGTVYTWGSGKYGQLGHATLRLRHEYIPRQVEALNDEKVVKVAAGACHTVALTDDGKLFTWGCGMAGIPHVVQYHVNASTPTQVLKGIKVLKFSVGMAHTVALSEDGRVFTWGIGCNFQLGHGNDHDQFVPKEIESLKQKVSRLGLETDKIVDVVAGKYDTVIFFATGRIIRCGRSNIIG